MRKILLFAAMLATPAMLLASFPSPFKADKENPFRYAYRSAGTLRAGKDADRQALQERMEAQSGMKKAEGEMKPSASLPSSDMTGFLDGPDGTTWYYTYSPVIEEVPVPGGYEGLTEKIVKEFQYSVYNNELRLIGTVRDKVEPDADLLETRAVQLSFGEVVTKKFFNVDDKYEVFVSIAMNRDLSQNPYPTVNYHTYAYTLGGEKDADGYDKKIAEIDGCLVGSVNSAPDKWAENYFLTFLTESCGNMDDYDNYEDWLNTCKYDLTTYSRATWGGGMKKFQEKSVLMNNLPGDQMNTPFMLTFVHDGKACFAFSEYEKSFYLSQGLDPGQGYSDPVQTQDNNLVISIYSDNSGTPELIQQTKIPVVIDKSVDKALYTYYGIGNMLYFEDVNYGDFLDDKSKATFIVNKQIYVAGNDDKYVNSYDVYDPDGEILVNLADYVDSFIEMSDVKGEKQICFIFTDGEAYTLKFTDLYTGTVDAEMGQFVNGRLITTAIDRVPYGDSYRYVISMSHGDTDAEGNTIHTICWLDNDCKLIEEQKLNLGKDIEYATFNIEASVLNPYIFNTDASYEYMGLVKRYSDSTHSSIREELVIVSTEQTVANFLPDAELGDLRTIAPMLEGDKKSLYILYYGNGKYTPNFYSLPFSKFTAGGDGTKENPYLISTAGDLTQLSTSLTGHYKLANDIDCSNVEIPTVGGSFQGSLDGDGHTIRNININTGLFNRIENGAEIKDINFTNVTVNPTGKDRSGIIASEASNVKISNIHITGLHVSEDSYDGVFGSIIGQGMLNTTVTGCSAANATISLPDASVGGIVGGLRTGVKISQCSFVGSIDGRTDVGGIAGSSITGDETITDCHVDADIVAQNTVGGIIGSSARGRITRCYVEGSIEATTANRWTDVGPCAGGIVGSLAPAHDAAEGYRAPAAENAVVADNLVRLESLKGYESTGNPEYAQQRTTMHRIVGYTRYNGEPDPQINTETEANIANNFAISTLAKVDDAIDDADTTTEGKSMTADKIDGDWFRNSLGFEFGADKPWNELAELDPVLNHETGAFFDPAVFNPEENTTFEAPLVIVSRTALDPEQLGSDFSCDSSDEDVAAPTGNFRLDGNTLYIEFQCSKIGTATVKAYVAGSQAVCTVNSKASGVEGIVSDNGSMISYDGSVLRAPGCAVSLYNTAGVLVAKGSGQVSTDGMQKGIYIAVAVSAGGKSTLKIAVR